MYAFANTVSSFSVKFGGLPFLGSASGFTFVGEEGGVAVFAFDLALDGEFLRFLDSIKAFFCEVFKSGRMFSIGQEVGSPGQIFRSARNIC